MRLSALRLPCLPAEIISSLSDCGIKTDTDLLFSNTVADIFQKLPPGTISFHDLNRLVDSVLEHVASPGIRADDSLLLLQKTVHARHLGLFTGVPELDELFLNGFKYPISRS
jgi:RAD51-like protein 3